MNFGLIQSMADKNVQVLPRRDCKCKIAVPFAPLCLCARRIVACACSVCSVGRIVIVTVTD